MKTARLITLLGCIVLVGSAAFHASGYPRLLALIQKDAITWPVSGVLKALWLAFSVLLCALAVVSWLARNMDHGGAIILASALASAVCAVLCWAFLGLFVGAYLLAAVTVLLALGGWMLLWPPRSRA